jgi:hypothetical protein
MSSITQVSEAMQTILSTRAKELERETGFVQRSTAQVDGPIFAQTTVFTWMSEPQASYSQLRHTAASLGVQVTNQAIEQRFGEASARLLRCLLEEAVGQVISSEASAPELLRRFNGVYVQDGTIISLPAELADDWRGCGGSTPEAGQSSMRVQVRLNLADGRLQGPWLQPGREAERAGPAHDTPLPAGCLYNVDSGYFTLAEMRAHGKAGRWWLTAAKAGVGLIDAKGVRSSLVSFLRAQSEDEVDVPVLLGFKEQLPARLLAKRVSPKQAKRRRERANKQYVGKAKGVRRPNARKRPTRGRRPRLRKRHKVSPARQQLLEWTILITNVSPEQLSLAEALVLARCRWQIELFWKLCKQHGQIDTWRSGKPFRVLSEIVAKWLGVVIIHWMTLLGCWQAPNRSLVKARQVVQWMTPLLAMGVAGVIPLETMVQRTAHSMASGCRVNSRRKKPATYQLVAHPKLIRGLD